MGKKNNLKFDKGFTLLELLISIGILAGVIFTVFYFIYSISNLGNYFIQSFEVQQELQLTFQKIIPEMRSMDVSNIGSYPLAEKASSSIKFYSDYDGNGLYDQVRYFVSSSTFKRGFIIPTDNPLTYNSANEKIDDLAHNIIMSTSSIFSYFGSNYTGSESELASSTVISNVRVIKIKLTAQQQNQKSPIFFSATVTPKSLQE